MYEGKVVHFAYSVDRNTSGVTIAHWVKAVEQSKDDNKIEEFSTWDTFFKTMIREFSALADFGSLVTLLNSFRQVLSPIC